MNQKQFFKKYYILNNICIMCCLIFFGGSCTKKNTKVALKSKNHTTFFRNLPTEPESLHPIRSSGYYAQQVQSYVLDTLLERNIDTYKWEPHLAKNWTISKNNKIFTFTIRSDVKWHDGRSLTVKDVAFSFKVVKDASYGGVHMLSYYENIKSIKIINSNTVQFTVGKKYFNAFSVLASLVILPEHIYKNKKQKNINNILVGSGPYILKKYDRGKKIILEQNKNWWGRAIKPQWHRIPKIFIRFIQGENNQLNRMASGSFDFLSLTAEAYIKKTNKKPWGTSIIKKKVPVFQSGYSFIGWNLTSPLFKNTKTRRALNYLMNRKLLNNKFKYGSDKLATGPWYSWSEYADSSVKPILFNPQKAQTLLKQDGWADTNKDGLLDKVINGKKIQFQFTLVFPNKDYEKYLTIYQQELKKNGINMSLRFMDWSAFLKLLHSKKMQSFMLGWSGGGRDIDPKQIWHSDSARDNGSNFINYSNPEVDNLIIKGRIEFNRSRRIKIFKKVYRLIAADAPYLFLFNSPTNYYSISKNVKIIKDTYKYSVGKKYWKMR